MKNKVQLARRTLELLQDLLAVTFESSWEIELISILCSSSKTWSSQELAEILPVDASAVDRCLTRLARDGFIARIMTTEAGGRYQYMPYTAEKSALVELLVEAHTVGGLSAKRMLYD